MATQVISTHELARMLLAAEDVKVGCSTDECGEGGDFSELTSDWIQYTKFDRQVGDLPAGSLVIGMLKDN